MDIMFVVVLSTIFLKFTPLTAVMIVVMSLLDDVPIMTIAYDNTPVSEKPIRWRMPQLLGVAAVLGLFLVVESFGLLLVGVRALSHAGLAGVLRASDAGPVADGDVSAARGRRTSSVVRHANGALVSVSAISCDGARRGDRRYPDPRGADVRLRLAGSGHSLEADRFGVGL